MRKLGCCAGVRLVGLNHQRRQNVPASTGGVKFCMYSNLSSSDNPLTCFWMDIGYLVESIVSGR